MKKTINVITETTNTETTNTETTNTETTNTETTNTETTETETTNTETTDTETTETETTETFFDNLGFVYERRTFSDVENESLSRSEKLSIIKCHIMEAVTKYGTEMCFGRQFNYKYDKMVSAMYTAIFSYGVGSVPITKTLIKGCLSSFAERHFNDVERLTGAVLYNIRKMPVINESDSAEAVASKKALINKHGADIIKELSAFSDIIGKKYGATKADLVKFANNTFKVRANSGFTDSEAVNVSQWVLFNAFVVFVFNAEAVEKAEKAYQKMLDEKAEKERKKAEKERKKAEKEAKKEAKKDSTADRRAAEHDKEKRENAENK